MSERWHGVCGSIQPPRVKTDECKDLLLFPARLYPSNETGNALKYNFSLPFTHSPFLSSFFPPLSCVSKPFRLSLNLDLTSHADSVGLWNCQSAVNKADFILAFFFTIRTQHLGLDWDLDSSRDFHSLLASFDLEHLTTTSTHKAGNQLDLIYTRNCTADNIFVEQLHISNHLFITFKLHFATCVPPTPLPFLPPIFPLQCPPLFPHLPISHLWMWMQLRTIYALL